MRSKTIDRIFWPRYTSISIQFYSSILLQLLLRCLECIWWNSIQTLAKLHSRAAHIIANMRNDIDQQSALTALGWEPVKAQRRKAKAKLMFKILNNMRPKCLNNLFTYKNQLSNYNLRDRSTTVCSPQPRTNNMKKSFMFDWASIWNSLPANIRESKSLSCFKRKIATHVFRY